MNGLPLLQRPTLFGLLVLLVVGLPGAPLGAADGDGPKILKFATMSPRSGRASREARKNRKRLDEATEGRIKVRVYWNGAAGDEKTVLRKMRAGQIDGSVFGIDIVRYFVPPAMVLAAPQTYTTYQQVDAVRRALTPEFDEIAYKNGYKILGWGDLGLTRVFSVEPIRRITDFQKMRPWLYEESPLLKEFYRMIGATGIPVGLAEVYGTLQAGMINVVWSSAVLAALLRWHAKTKYVSALPVGVIQGAFVFSRRFWDSLQQHDREAILEMAERDRKSIQKEMRQADKRVYASLMKRGLRAVEWEDRDKWRAVGKRLRDRMVGRIYSRELLRRVEKIVAQYPDDPRYGPMVR